MYNNIFVGSFEGTLLVYEKKVVLDISRGFYFPSDAQRG
jgi:hypothetical protein